MAFVVKDRIKETTTTTGTGTYTLAGAANGGYETFANIGNANKTYYACTDGTNWEVGLGTYTASGTTLSRDEIIESSNSNNAVSWGSGTKDIFVTLPSSKALVMDNNDDFNIASGDAIMFGAGTSFANMSLSINGSTGALGLSEPSFGTSVLNLTAQQLKGIGDGGDLHFLGQTTGGASRFRLYGGNTNVLTTNGDGSGVSINGALTASGDLTVDTNTLHVDSTNNRVGIGTSSPSTILQVTGNSTSRNTIVSNFTLDGGTSVANPYENFGFGINFIGRDYGNAVRNYASINTIMEHKSSSSGGGDAGFETGLSFYTNGGGASDTDPSERMRIDSSGRVGIGTSSPSAKLNVVGSAADDGISIKSGGNGGVDPFKVTWSGGTEGDMFIVNDGGKVGIGTSSPDELLHIHGATQSYIKLTDNDSGQGATDGALFAFDGSSATQYIWNYENGPTVFATNSSEAMRIDSSGNVLVGRTSSSGFTTSAGSAHFPNGSIFTTVDGGQALNVSRLTSDGDIAGFYKDGTKVGSIGATGGRLYIGDDTVALRIVGDADEITPWNATANTNRDAAIALGNSTNRFTDLYLSGNITGPSQVTRDTNTSSLALAGGTNSNVGSNILLYGGSHASLAGVTRFRNGSSETMRIDSSGRVGIGQTSLSSMLHLRPSSDTNSQITMEHPSSGNSYGGFVRSLSGTNQGLAFGGYFNGTSTERMRIDSSGNLILKATSDTGSRLQINGADETSELLEIGITSGHAQLTATHASGGSNTAGFIFRTRGGGTTAERMRITSSGSVGIGTSSPSRTLTLVDATSDGSGGLLIQNYLPVIELDDASGGGTSTIIKHDGTNTIIENGGSERMRITSAGRVGVGVTDPDAGIELQTSLGDLNSVHIANTSSTGYGAKFIGGGNTVLRYIADFRDYNNQSRLRVDGSGNLLVGLSSAEAVGTNAGTQLRADGLVYAAATSDAHILSRRSSDGAILNFRKDTTTVGSILATSGDLSIGTGDTGLRFSDSTDSIYPISSTTGFSRDAAVDIGYSTVRFKDLYLSGGVYLGGTGPAISWMTMRRGLGRLLFLWGDLVA